MEKAFADEIIAERNRLFYGFSVSLLGTQRRANGTDGTRSGHIVLMMEDVLKQCRKWLTGFFALHGLFKRHMGTDDVYSSVAVLLHSYLTGLSPEKSLYVLEALGCNPTSLERVSFISIKIPAHPETGRGNLGDNVCGSWRDEVFFLDTFENTTYDMSRKIFLTPVHTFATLDDDVYGTRAK